MPGPQAGPLLFDVGASVIGCCYRSGKDEDNGLDLERVKTFLSAYNAVRSLTPIERAHVVPFMRVALLCNATWRFRNFNIVHPEVEEARDAYKELADRLEDLRGSAEFSVAADVQAIVDALPWFRPVKAEDRDAVAELARHTYNGHDWIMTSWNAWLQQRDGGRLLGFELEGRLAGIENVRIVDGGTTGWLEALRVHPAVRGRGLAGQLQQKAIDVATRTFPGLECFRYTTHALNRASRKLASRCGLSEVYKWGVVLLSSSSVAAAPATPDGVKEPELFAAVPLAEYVTRVEAEIRRIDTGMETLLPSACGKRLVVLG